VVVKLGQHTSCGDYPAYIILIFVFGRNLLCGKLRAFTNQPEESLIKFVRGDNQ